MTTTAAWLRLCFIVLFGAMSLMHGPIMAYSGGHADAAFVHQGSDHGGHGDHPDDAPPMKHAQCNSFACFLAVEPLPAFARPLHPILFAILAAAPAPALDPIRTQPDLPPPRIQG